MADSWKTVALLLGARMKNHAYCPERHKPLRPDECPFCADLEAYLRFKAKAASSRCSA